MLIMLQHLSENVITLCYSTCFVFTSLDNGWGILSDHGSIYEHNWTLYEPIMAAPSVP